MKGDGFLRVPIPGRSDFRVCSRRGRFCSILERILTILEHFWKKYK